MSTTTRRVEVVNGLPITGGSNRITGGFWEAESGLGVGCEEVSVEGLDEECKGNKNLRGGFLAC